MEFKGSKTEKNLLAAFAGESQARNRYIFVASEAKKAGYEQISALKVKAPKQLSTSGQPFPKDIAQEISVSRPWTL